MVDLTVGQNVNAFPSNTMKVDQKSAKWAHVCGRMVRMKFKLTPSVVAFAVQLRVDMIIGDLKEFG